MRYTEIETEGELISILRRTRKLSYYAFQNLNFRIVEHLAIEVTFSECIFLGCVIPISLRPNIVENCLVFSSIEVPYNPFLSTLYNRHTLMGGYEPGIPESYQNTLDKVVYDHYMATGKEARDIKESLARRLHDHAITDALYEFLDLYDERRIVAIMGGHNLRRGEAGYVNAAVISKQLTEAGYLMISGGGPGAMEATHVGAWMAGKPGNDLNRAVEILSQAPLYTDKGWLDKAFEVLELYPDSAYQSLGIPTWLYGHEPPTPFATHIAKYFANSVREDGLLAIAKGGVIFTPGSAGTIQEIFQDATQNHYLSYGYASPMVFMNRDFWTADRPVYPLLKQLADDGKYQNMILSLCDTVEEVLSEIKRFTNAGS